MPEAAVAVTPPAPPPPPAAPPAASPPPASAGAPPPAPPAGAAPEKQPPAPAAPAAEIEIKLPNGAKVDQAQLDAFKSKAKEWGLNSEQASKLVEHQLTSGAAQMEALKQQVQKSRDADLEALRGDPEFGGAKFDRTVAGARSALQQFFGEDASKLFTAYGIENHPALVKGLSRIRSAIAEDDTSSRAPKPAPDEPKTPPQTQTQRLAKRYDKKK